MTNKAEREGKTGEAENNRATKQWRKQRSEGKRKDLSPEGKARVKSHQVPNLFHAVSVDR